MKDVVIMEDMLMEVVKMFARFDSVKIFCILSVFVQSYVKRSF